MTEAGGEHETGLRLPLRRFALQRRRRSDRPLFLPLHDLPEGLRQAFRGRHLFWAELGDAPDDRAIRVPPPSFAARDEARKCAKCGNPVVESAGLSRRSALAFVPSQNFPRPAELPAPDRHIFYHRRVADIADAVPKLERLLGERSPCDRHRFRRPFGRSTRRLNDRREKPGAMRNFLIDTDTASDDAVAIIMALAEPSVRVLGPDDRGRQCRPQAGDPKRAAHRRDLQVRRARLRRRGQAAQSRA